MHAVLTFEHHSFEITPHVQYFSKNVVLDLDQERGNINDFFHDRDMSDIFRGKLCIHLI